MIRSRTIYTGKIARYDVYPNTQRQRNAICSLLATFKRFGLVPLRTRWYINSSGTPPMVDVIYAN